MSIIAYLTALSPTELQRLQDTPDDVTAFLFPDDGDNEPPNTLSLQKAWHGLHYLLTGEAVDTPPPFGNSILGGTALGPDIAYGPARFLAPEEVVAVHTALAGITPETLAQRFDPEAMDTQQIYAANWEAEGKEALDWLLAFFPDLQAFYRDAAARGDAALLWMS